MDERLAWIAVAWSRGMSATVFAALVEAFGSAEAILKASPEELAAAWPRRSRASLDPERAAQRLEAAAENIAELEEELDDLAEEGVKVLCSFEPGFPARLRDARRPPAVICVRGDLGTEDDPALAIIGTRTPTQEGRRLALELARTCAIQGVTVVSGLALGCDTAAHQGALQAGGRTIAVLGNGIRRIYPPENHDLALEIAQRGALVSELPPRARQSTARLMARNRLQAALSRGVLVIEAGASGGAFQTVRSARRQKRLIYAADWDSDKQQAIGTKRLLREGARPVRGPADIAAVVGQLRSWPASLSESRSEQPQQPTLF